MRVRLAAPMALLALAFAAPAASAAGTLDFKPCAQPAGVQCATIDVPIDRSGNVPGTFTLLVHRRPAPHPSGQPPLVFLAGGPGQTNTDLTTSAIQRYKPALDKRDLIVFAQRGTGPTAIHCAGIESGAPPQDAMPACADQLGPARNFYTSRDAADDLDDIRAALGVDKIAIATASYGTWVAQGYAIRHPDHLDRMVLDSTVGPDQNADVFGVAQFKEGPALARALCHHHACRGLTSDAYGDLVKLYKRLTAKPLKAQVVGPTGKRSTVTIGGLQVVALLPDLDIDPNLRAELPRAIVSALHGDGALMARLVAGGPAGPPADPAGAVNFTLNSVTHCEEDVQPFDRTASPDERLRQAHEALAKIDPSIFAPFGPDIAFLLSGVPSCAYWPMAPDQPSFGSSARADVPVLLLHGEFDLRSSKASTLTVAREFPHSKVLIVPNAGHSPTRFEASHCSRSAAAQFLNTGTAPAKCKRTRDPWVVRPLVPRSVRAAGSPAAAAQLTVADAFNQLDDGSMDRPSVESKVRGGGLRGGWFRGTGHGVELHGFTFVRGFPVSGTVSPGKAVVLRFPGGRLRFAPDGTFTGRVGKLQVGGSGRIQRQSVARRLAAAGLI